MSTLCIMLAMCVLSEKGFYRNLLGYESCYEVYFCGQFTFSRVRVHSWYHMNELQLVPNNWYHMNELQLGQQNVFVTLMLGYFLM